MLENNINPTKYLSIGKIAKDVGVETHTIRFWTEEFKEHITFIVGKGERKYYSQEAIDVFKRINNLIHTKGIKIRSIKEQNLLSANETNQETTFNPAILNQIEEKLESIISVLTQKTENF